MSCPSPLKKTAFDYQSDVLEGSCELPCPSLLYTKEEYDKSDALMAVLTGIGMVLGCLALGTFYFFRKTRKNTFMMYFQFFLFTISWTLFFGITIKNDRVEGLYPKMYCKNEYESRKDGYCAWMGFVMIYFGLAACCSWGVQAIDIWLKIRFRADKWKEQDMRMVSCCCCCSAPSLFVSLISRCFFLSITNNRKSRTSSTTCSSLDTRC